MHKLIRKIFEDKSFGKDLLRLLNSSYSFEQVYRLMQQVCHLPHFSNIGPNFPFNVIQYIGGRHSSFIIRDTAVKTQKRWYQLYSIGNDVEEDNETIASMLKLFRIPFYSGRYFPSEYKISTNQWRKGFKEAYAFAKSQVWEDRGMIVAQYDSSTWGTLWFNTKYKSEIEAELDLIGLRYEMVVDNEL